MDDLAPAPAQRTSDSGGRGPEGNFANRKRLVKKVRPVSAEERAPKPEPEPALEPDPAPDHQLDVLA
jgi:hypothetical protein